MKLTNMQHLTDWEELFLSHMRIDIREKMQNSKVFIIVYANDTSEASFSKEGYILKDSNKLCYTRENFINIDFKILSDDEFKNNPKEYFKDKYICHVRNPAEVQIKY